MLLVRLDLVYRRKRPWPHALPGVSGPMAAMLDPGWKPPRHVAKPAQLNLQPGN